MDTAPSIADKPYANNLKGPDQYELSELVTSGSQQHTPARSTVPAESEGTVVALQAVPDDGVIVQELAPVDRGVRAWMFCCCSFILETMIWGFCFRSVPIRSSGYGLACSCH